jgi:hypothetical protein
LTKNCSKEYGLNGPSTFDKQSRSYKYSRNRQQPRQLATDAAIIDITSRPTGKGCRPAKVALAYRQRQ